jgi:hypothetical protein
MRKAIYWKCSPDVSAEIIKSHKAWRKLVATANKLAKSFGATGIFTTRGFFGDPSVSGFAFDDPPDKKLFVKLKNTTNGYRPRAGTELEKQLKEFECGCIRLAMNLAGIKLSMSADDGGFYINSAGVSFAGETVYLTTHGMPTKGGKRVSDIEFERAAKGAK